MEDKIKEDNRQMRIYCLEKALELVRQKQEIDVLEMAKKMIEFISSES